MKKHNDDPIRQALLTAAEEEARQALENQPEEAAFSPAYQTWEARFLRDPVAFRLAPPPSPCRLPACGSLPGLCSPLHHRRLLPRG